MKITLHRNGDAFEAYEDEAREVAQTIGLTLTTHRSGIPMCGFWEYNLPAHTKVLEAAGHTVELA